MPKRKRPIINSKPQFKVGLEVEARTVIAEANVNGNPKFVHAKPGERGYITDLSVGGFPIVTFNQTKTTIITAPSEVAIVS